ncbi:MAG: hypothetical protein HOL29_09385 [Euryarchaeota archaeon]|nr:hypothetical protein [Euryarchaeota archaeon]
MASGLDSTDKQKKAVALLAIADQAGKRAAAGESPLETQTFINGARRELARELPDTKKMEDAFQVSREYQRTRDPGQRPGQGV